MKASIAIATRDKSKYLARTLTAIAMQRVDFECELIVVNDGSQDDTGNFLDRLQLFRPDFAGFSCRVIHLANDPNRFNPAYPRNVAYRHSVGDILVCMSDDVIMSTPNTLQQLVDAMRPGIFCITTVHNYDAERGQIVQFTRNTTQLTGLENQRPFFFLGAVWRSDMYAIGGCDERFTGPAFDDDRARDGLIRGLKLEPVFLPDVIGWHQDHPRPAHYHTVQQSRKLYERISYESEMTGDWFSPGAPWTLENPM